MLQAADFRLQEINQAFIDFSGYSRAQLIGLDPLQLLPEEDRAARQAARTTRIDGAWPALGEGRLIDAGGRERWYRSAHRLLPDGAGQPLHLSVLQDATAEHVASERAAHSARELDDWFELSPVGMVLFDASGLLVRSNPAFEARVAHVPVSLDLAPAELQQLLAWGEGDVLAALQPGAAPIERHGWLHPPHGAAQRLRSIVQCYRGAGGQPRYMGILEDRSIEEERDLAQLQLGTLMDTAGVGLATFQESSGWVRQRQGSGATTPSAALQSIGRELVTAESLPEFERLQQALRQAQRAEVRYAIVHPELGVRWLLTRVEPATLASGKRTTSVVTLDITEQQLARDRAERAVAQQAERTRAILDSVLVGIVTVDADGIEWMNRSACRMFGGSLDEFRGQAIAIVAPAAPDHPFRRTGTLDELDEGRAETFECRVLGRDGREFGVVGNVVVTREAGGQRQLTYALLDIERRRQAEARMTAAQASLQRVIEAAPLAIALIDAASLRVVQANEVAAQSVGRAVHDLIGRTPEDLFDAGAAGTRRRDMQQALASHAVTTREYRRGQGTHARVWDARYLPLATVPGQPPDQLLLVATDVSEQRAAQEARLETAIAQREMLVREVHHRIKNNLQGVAGLLQQIAHAKPEVAPAIGEVIGQVQAIAQVYGLQVGGTAALALVRVVEAIVSSVQRNFGRAMRIDVTGEAPRWTLPEAEAIPIALTVNELLTNAIKHSDRAGEIVCALAADAAGVRLTIANPARLAPGFDLARIPGGSAGLGLVRALLPRRGAELALEQRGPQVVATLALRPPALTG